MGDVVDFLALQYARANPPEPNEQNPSPPPQRGAIRRRARSQNLYVGLQYRGRHIEKSTGLADTPENRVKVRAFLDRAYEKIDDGTFRYAEAFPNASEEEKELFSRLEGREHRPPAGGILFGDYVAKWMVETLAKETSETKKRDFTSALRTHVLPYFQDRTFEEISGLTVVNFVKELRAATGRTGQPLSASRIRNILLPLRAVWEDACEEHDWDLRNPFDYLKRKNRGGRVIPKRRKNPPEVFRFADWLKVVDAMDPHFRPVAELMVLTGMIASELAGLRRQDIQEHVIHVQNSVVLGVEKSELKTAYRVRDIPITQAIRKRLDLLLEREPGEHLVKLPNGKPFDACRFWRTAWKKALRDAGLPHRRPYATRHSFASWSLLLGMNPTRLVSLMGHGSKQMVYEVYAKYVEGIEEDTAPIREYFGPDFK